MVEYRYRFEVPSHSGGKPHIVTCTFDGVWACDCIGWTRHFPRRDCTHIKEKKAELEATETPEESANLAWRDRADELDMKRRESAPTAASAVKAGASKEEAADVARIKREETQAKKVAKLGKLPYGFQLAETYRVEDGDLSRGEWVAEIKFDGELAMMLTDGRLINRSGNDITHRFPEIHGLGTSANTTAVVVGEIVVLDEYGFSHFNKVQERSTDDPIKIRVGAKENTATFMVFDILELNGRDLTSLPFRERRMLLVSKIAFDGRDGRVRLVEQIPITGPSDVKALVKKCRELEQEGVMLKNMDAPYVAKRGRNWIKAKTWQEREFEVLRWENTGIGDGFVIIIKSGQREQPVVVNGHKDREAIKAGKNLKAEIKFLSEADDGALRFPSFRRLTETDGRRLIP